MTNSDGRAQVAWTPALAAGSYATGAAFAGDSLYTAATGSGSVAIAEGDQPEYTGAKTGAPNKTVTLSAVLKDATGTPLSGRAVVFVLGSQTVSGDERLRRRHRQPEAHPEERAYALTATWTPAGADAARYIGSAASATFKLQAK